MKLHLISDEHLDHDPEADESFIANLRPQPNIDVLVLAGDWFSVCRPGQTTDYFNRLLDYYDQIVVVPGNHSYWHATPNEANQAIMDAVGNSARIHAFIEPGVRVIKGQEFLGGTLWYPKPSPRKQQDFIDFRQISAPREWFFEQHKLFMDVFEAGGEDSLKDTIVVSHHLPHPNSTPPQFKGSPGDHFFCTNLTGPIMKMKPKLWLHGHSHDPCDYVVGSTRIVNNPRGYPHEHRNRAPYEPLLIEVK